MDGVIVFFFFFFFFFFFVVAVAAVAAVVLVFLVIVVLVFVVGHFVVVPHVVRGVTFVLIELLFLACHQRGSLSSRRAGTPTSSKQFG